jgi:hypothetical protein
MTGHSRRLGTAMAEVVLAMAVLFVGSMLLFGLGCVACNLLYHAVATLVGWPML